MGASADGEGAARGFDGVWVGGANSGLRGAGFLGEDKGLDWVGVGGANSGLRGAEVLWGNRDLDCTGVAGANRGLGGAAVGGENKGLGREDEADLVAPAGDDRKPCSCASRILAGLVVGMVVVVVGVWGMPGVERRALLGVVCWRTGLGGRER